MPSLLNKMKGAMHGDGNRDEAYYEGEDEYNYDRNPQPDYQHTVDAHGNVTSHNAGDQLPGHHNSGIAGNDFANQNQTHTTSSFGQGLTQPAHDIDNNNSHSFVTDKHRDGRDYIPPRGTAVVQPGAGVDNNQYGNQHGGLHQSPFERSEQGLTGRDQYGQTGHDHIHDSSSRKAVRDKNLMDPADTAHGSNVMDPNALPDDPDTKPRDERGPLRKLFHKKHDDDRQYDSDLPPNQQSNLPLRNQHDSSLGYRNDGAGGLGTAGATTAVVGAGALAHENRDRDHNYNRGNNQRQQQPLSEKTATLVSAGPTGAPHHFGPGYPGHKVVHACDHCGQDNDITHYFGRDVVYRIHR